MIPKDQIQKCRKHPYLKTEALAYQLTTDSFGHKERILGSFAESHSSILGKYIDRFYHFKKNNMLDNNKLEINPAILCRSCCN